MTTPLRELSSDNPRQEHLASVDYRHAQTQHTLPSDLSETHARIYWWCSPPKTGTANV